MGLFDGTPLERAVTCEHCGKTMDGCACPRGANGHVVLPRDQQVRVHRERRRGKWTTVINGLDPDATDLKGLAKELRGKLGAGGTVNEGAIEIQGDHRDAIVELLAARGYAVKASGG